MKLYNWSDITKLLQSGSKDSYFASGSGISTGSFDGLHKGHQVLINTLVQECKILGIPAGVVTFTKPLPSIKNQSEYKGDISSLEDRLSLLEKMGVEFAVIVDFDESFASMSGEDFLGILIKVCNMKILCEGVDFRCGYKGLFDKNAIADFCSKNNVQVSFTEPVYYEIDGKQVRISSSIIRQLIIKKDYDLVSQLLGRKYKY